MSFQVTELDGVYSIHEPHFWTLCSDVFVGTIKIEVAPNADAKYIVSQTHNIFTQVSIFILSKFSFHPLSTSSLHFISDTDKLFPLPLFLIA